MAAFIVMQKYVTRAFEGKWKQAGDTFGQEHQYDPRWHDNVTSRGTRACFFHVTDVKTKTGIWVNTRCYQQNCFQPGRDCSTIHSFPADQVVPDPSLVDDCTPCIQSCSQNNPDYADCADDVN